MQIITEDRISSISTTNEDTNYPVENALDDHVKKVYKTDNTGVSTITLYIESVTNKRASQGSNAVALFGLNNCSYVEFDWGESTTIEYGVLHEWGYKQRFLDRLFFDYGRMESDSNGEHILQIKLDGDGLYKPQVGRIYAGFSFSIPDPKTLVTSKEDKSIIVDLDNGFEYTYKRNQVENADLDIQFTDADMFYGIRGLLDESVPNPIVAQVDGIPDYSIDTNSGLPFWLYRKFLFYGRLKEPCKVNIPDQFQYNISFGLREVL
jgi:hypothetical protein